jgi:putative flavoprotein involved in K+ transport
MSVVDELPHTTHTAVIGAGQAGLIISRLLRQAGRDHVVLERRETLGGGWLDRWDAFRLVSPNFASSLPDFPYDGPEPDAYMTRDAIAGRTAAYAAVIDAPVALGAEVRRLSQVDPDGRPPGFHIETDRGTVRATEVVVATGAFHQPRIPATAAFGPRIHQVHAHHYRNPDALPPGGVLVVGSGQTGVQLAEELHAAGRAVTLSVGHCGRAARRYRDRDWFWWVLELVHRGPAVGAELPTVDTLPDPRQKFACNPHMSGHDGGHDTDLRRFAADGMRLVGRFEGADGERVRFAEDLEANLRFADGFFDERIRPLFEKYAQRAGLDLPADDRVPFPYTVPEVSELDLAAEGISSVVWTTGYAPDYAWLDVPVIGEAGVPRHVRGVSDVPGLTFIGLLFQLDNGSANLTGVARDAEYLASRWERV